MKTRITGIAAIWALTLLMGCSMLYGPEKIEDIPVTVNSLRLVRGGLTIKAGAMEYLELTVTPESSRNNAVVSWEWDPEVISCQADNYGAVVTGVKAGNTALTVKSGNITNTCIVTVTGSPPVEDSGDPYIYSDYNVIQTKAGITQKVNVSLYGGTVSDAAQFTWNIDRPDIAGVTAAGQYCAITGLTEGIAQIIVTHPRTTQSYSMLVYVMEDAARATYITTQQNIVTMYTDGGEKSVSVDLMNPANESYKQQFSWEIVNDNGSMLLAANSNNAVITPVRKGTTTVRVSHPQASYPQDILVRVIELVNNVVIETDKTIVTINGADTQIVTATIAGLADYSNEFAWEVADTEVADIVTAGNQILVSGKKNGFTKVTITHPDAPYSREIMLLVRNQAENAITASMYITTSQNYLRTKVGIEGTMLSVSLVGGVPGDEANFKWEVSDGGIIKLETTHGNAVHRGIFDSRSNGTAYIDGLKEGTAVVTVTHPKIVVPTEILVKVLPVTALLQDPLYLLGGNIIGIVVGTQKNAAVTLSGNGKTPSDAEGIRWETDNSGVVTVSGSGESALLTAAGVGETYITVTHPKVEVPKRILVYAVNTEAELLAVKLIYTIKNYHVTAAGKSVKLTLAYNNLTRNELQGISWTIDESDIGSFFLGSDNTECIVTGLKAGTTRIYASHPLCAAPVVFDLTVLPAETVIIVDPATGEPIREETVTPPGINTNYLSGENIIGIVVGQSRTTTVSLIGKDIISSDRDSITWNIDSTSVATLSSAGDTCMIQAVGAGQSYITVTHAKAAVPKKILVYTANSEAELLAAKLIYTTKNYHVIAAGKTAKLVLGYNNLTASELQGIRWTVDNPGVASLSLGVDNTECVVTGLQEGTTQVRASHPSCAAAVVFDLVVLPAGTVITVDPVTGEEIITNYLSGDNIIGIVVGQSKQATVRLTGRGILPGDSGTIVWTTEDAAVATVSGSGESALIQAAGVGQTYITVTHPKAAVPKKILVYTANTEAELLAAKLIYTTKNSHVIAAGKTAKLVLGYNNLSASELQGIRWTVDNPGVASLSLGVDNTECVVTGLQEGTTQVRASHPSCAAAVVFDLTVMPAGTVITTDPATGEEITAAPGVNTNSLSGENIIGIRVGQSKTTTVKLSGKDIAPGDSDTITWTTANATVATVSGSGDSALVKAAGTGETYITASHGKAANQKKILVYTANTEAALSAAKEIYTVKNSYTIITGSKETLYLNCINIAENELSGIIWQVANNTIASIAVGKNNRECIVTGLREGRTTVTASHTGSGIPVTFTIDVITTQTAVGIVAAPPVYFTTGQNVIQFSTPGASKEASVTPMNLPPEEYYLIDWSVENSGICTIVPNGNKVTITAKAEGETVIRAAHDRAENILKITVRVGNEFIYNNPVVPYIDTASDVVTMVKGSADKIIEAALVNADTASGFSFSVDRPTIATITSQFSTGKCFVKPLEAGQAELTISHPNAALDKKVILVVGNSPVEIEGLKYLTTSQNVVTIPEGSTKIINVSVQGSQAAVITGYTWETSHVGVVSVSSTGATAVLTANGTGSAVVTVKQSGCPYPLEIIVMVIDPTAAAEHPYISTSNSIYMLTVGQAWKTLEAELIGGKGGDEVDFVWNTASSSLVSLYGQGKTATVKAIGAGTAIVTITHPKAHYPRTIRLICENPVETNCYISVPESIITLKPTDGEKTITANLVNGTAEDRYNFRWSLDTFDIVELNYSANVASIRPLSQGQTTLHITHPKAAYEQQIVVKVSEYTTFSFGKDSQIITEGMVTFIHMQVPSTAQTTHVEYETSSSRVASISGTKAVAQITGAGEGTAVVTAKLVATVTNAVQAQAEMLVYCEKAATTLTYISSGNTVYTLEKGISRNISAELIGPDVIVTDVNNLTWQSSDTGVIKISGASTTGVATGKQVNVQAAGAGECTITVSHDKSNSSLVLYFIVPGSDDVEISLSKTYITLETGSNTEIRANLTNAKQSDYASIVWDLARVDNVALGTLLGSGQTVAIYATKAGTTKIRATLPNGTYAECSVLIQAARQFAFSMQSVRLAPGEEKTVNFTVTPEDADINFMVQNDSYFTYSYSLANKQVTITGKKEGTATLSGVTSYGNKASLNVICAWDYEFSLGKSVISSEPRSDASAPDKFIIPYTVNPSSAGISVSLTNTAIADYVLDQTNRRIVLTPKGEGTGDVIVNATNPNDGNKVFSTKTCALNLKYSKVTLVPEIASKTGSFSTYNSAVNMLTLGDGEAVTLSFSIQEPNVQYTLGNIRFVKSDSNSAITLTENTNNLWRITHPTDTVDHDYTVYHDIGFSVDGNSVSVNNWSLSTETDKAGTVSQYYICDTGYKVKIQVYEYSHTTTVSGTREVPGQDTWESYTESTPHFAWKDYETNLLLVTKNSGIVTAARVKIKQVNNSYKEYFLLEGVSDTEVGSRPGVSIVRTPIIPQVISVNDFRANPKWYAPVAGQTDGFIINDTARYESTPSTAVKSVNLEGYLSGTITHNAVNQNFQIPVQVETRGCAFNQ